jgi:DNA-binding CsgD family transcriptional regulator
MQLLGRQGECGELDQLLTDVNAGRSRVLVLRGDAGAGKTALLTYLEQGAEGSRVARAVGVESEMELAYSGLHQLCQPLIDAAERLPSAQRNALERVFGMSEGPPADRFLVGLATLSLFADVAEERPLVCIIDDAHWLDESSAQIIGFVARRLLAERIAVICAVRRGIGDAVLAGLPELSIDGLGAAEARALLLGGVHGPMDAAVVEQIVAESHGNPLALLELPQTWDAAALAGGFGFPSAESLAGKIEQSYATRLRLLPPDTRLFALAAAAEPSGDQPLLSRAVRALGVGMDAADPAIDAGLLSISGRVEFSHPLIRSAAYRSASEEHRHAVHRSLADATDPSKDPDRRAWHNARATLGPDEVVAAELERSADRAEARAGVAASAAFLDRAVALSADHANRVRRALAAATAKQLAGSPEAALALLAIADEGAPNALQSAMAQHLRGEIALDLRRADEAVSFLFDAARRLETLDGEVARETYLEALQAASFGGRFSEEALRRIAEAARTAPAAATPTPDDLMLDALAIRFTEGYEAGASALKQALAAVRAQDLRDVEDVRWPGFARRMAPDMYDDDCWHDLITRCVQLARERGALGVLPLALTNLAFLRMYEGDLEGAGSLVEEADAIADATGAARIAFGRPLLDSLRGDEGTLAEGLRNLEATARARGEGVILSIGNLARATLNNGLGRYEAAMTAAEGGSDRDEPAISQWLLEELVEASARSGRADVAAVTLERLTERTAAAGTDWAVGIQARSHALVSKGSPAEDLYREAIDRLARTRIAPAVARAHLVYGEWLRREGRRMDARKEIRAAYDAFAAMGMRAFADRARRELKATGEKVRKRTEETAGDLTPQEEQIARLARDGFSNPEIGSQLFISARTVEWHLRKVFTKLDITSRRQLRTVLRDGDRSRRSV